MKKEQLEKLKKEVSAHVISELNKKYHMVPRIQMIIDGSMEEYLGIAMGFVCTTHAVSFEDMCSKSRIEAIVFPRQLFCYIIRRYCGDKISFREIGQFINQNHATVIHAVNHIKDMVQVDKHRREHVDLIYQGFHDTVKELEFKVQAGVLENLKQTA